MSVIDLHAQSVKWKRQLGEDISDRPTYEVPASCFNCKWSGKVRQTVGARVPRHGMTCPNCGCNEVGR